MSDRITSADRLRAQVEGSAMLPNGDTIYDGAALESELLNGNGAAFQSGNVADVVERIRRQRPGYDLIQRSNETLYQSAERWDIETSVSPRQLGFNGRESRGIER
jgi:hypothetical protein